MEKETGTKEERRGKMTITRLQKKKKKKKRKKKKKSKEKMKEKNRQIYTISKQEKTIWERKRRRREKNNNKKENCGNTYEKVSFMGTGKKKKAE